MTPATMEDEVIEETEQLNSISEGDVFDTPEFEVPATKPQVHHAQITEVTCGHSQNKGTPFLAIGIVSTDVPTLDTRKTSLTIWLPKGWEENIGNPSFKRDVLPGNEQASYIRNIANADKSATLQRYVFNQEGVAVNSKGKEFQVKDSIARAAGRNPIELGLKKATTLEEYAENVNKMLQGLSVVIIMRERGGDDPVYAHNLETKDMFSPETLDLEPKRFKNYEPAWA